MDRAAQKGAGLGHAEMERQVGPLRQLPVGRHRLSDVRRLHRHDDVAEALVLQQLHVLQRRGDERLPLLQTAAVHADADGDALRLRRPRDGLDVGAAADVARVEAERLDARLDRRQRAAVVEMDIRHERHGALLRRPSQDLRRLHIGDREPHDVGPRLGAGAEMRGNGGKVVRIVGQHRLHAHRRAAAQRHAADLHRPCRPARRHSRHSLCCR